MRKIVLSLIILCFGIGAMAQHTEVEKDTIEKIEEVRINGVVKRKIQTDLKMSVSVDEFLSSSKNISFIKRGAYAWEPLLNNMSSERSSITIDGMHIFGACTDKMDPITTYVESNNLSSIDINSGQQGSMHGATVAGSIDLKRRSTMFTAHKTWSGAFQTGFEFNNKQYFNLGNLSYSSNRFVADGSIAIRKAENYFDGQNNEVKHSQYNKLNGSLGLAYKTSELSSIKVDAIFDQAKDVGYPALPMDLWLSRAIITSATYKQMFEDGIVKVWDTKVYFNAIEHYMDDTKRPENLVHMDMPGWSTTYGLVSKVNLTHDRLSTEVQLNVYENLSIAEMTMYPQDRSKKTMFAYSWPWVTSRLAGLSINNSWAISQEAHLNLGGTLNWNFNSVRYPEFNRIFHPGTPQEKNRLLPGLHLSYHQSLQNFSFSLGSGYGHRAPSVSEGYGYYIYNSFDRYDYIGNPDLKNEISYEANASASYTADKLGIEAKVNYFYIQNYIIGKIMSLGSPMNYQSVGVKGYTSLNYAKLFNLSLDVNYNLLEHLHWKGTLTYAKSQDNKGGNLPFIRPLSYLSSLHFLFKNFGIQTSVTGDFEHRNFSPEYGEDRTSGFTIVNASADYTIAFNQYKAILQLGAENILNSYYSTYADWGNIPRMGRNMFVALKVSF